MAVPPYEPVKPTASSTFSLRIEMRIGGTNTIRGKINLVEIDSLDKLLLLLERVSFKSNALRLLANVTAMIGKFVDSVKTGKSGRKISSI